MRLTNYSFTENFAKPNEWKLDALTLEQTNLVVGTNSAGKSRTLATVSGLARLLSGRLKPAISSGVWNCEFTEGAERYAYRVRIENSNVLEESYTQNGLDRLQRGADGAGMIYTTKEDKLIEFQTPTSDLAVVMRRDNKQHQFLEKLHGWGMSVFAYLFGTKLGQDSYGVLVTSPVSVDIYNQEQVVGIFRQGERELGAPFIQAITSDMGRLGYSIENIGTSAPTVMGAPSGILGMYVKERSLSTNTEQATASQGMFRALSTLIQINYAQMSLNAGCIIVDDIGEGLDFARSCGMIDLLREKVATSQVQTIFSTNDRFIMNHVPLKCWTLLKRTSHHVEVFNYRNSKEAFDDFKFTGLSNFEFFATDFLTNAALTTGEDLRAD